MLIKILNQETVRSHKIHEFRILITCLNSIDWNLTISIRILCKFYSSCICAQNFIKQTQYIETFAKERISDIISKNASDKIMAILNLIPGSFKKTCVCVKKNTRLFYHQPPPSESEVGCIEIFAKPFPEKLLTAPTAFVQRYPVF